MSETLPVCDRCGKTVTKHCTSRCCDWELCIACRRIRIKGREWQDRKERQP